MPFDEDLCFILLISTEDTQLIKRVYEYLYRYGYINFGVYKTIKPVERREDAPKVRIFRLQFI